MSSSLATRATMYIAMWIKYKKHDRLLSKSKDLDEFKRVIASLLFNGKKPDEKFIKGARLIRWDSLYQSIKSS